MVLFSTFAGNLTINNSDFFKLYKGFIIICIQINVFGIQGITQFKIFADNFVQIKLIYVTLNEGLNPKLD